jgi:hypothetical protein
VKRSFSRVQFGTAVILLIASLCPGTPAAAAPPGHDAALKSPEWNTAYYQFKEKSIYLKLTRAAPAGAALDVSVMVQATS